MTKCNRNHEVSHQFQTSLKTGAKKKKQKKTKTLKDVHSALSIPANIYKDSKCLTFGEWLFRRWDYHCFFKCSSFHLQETNNYAFFSDFATHLINTFNYNGQIIAHHFCLSYSWGLESFFYPKFIILTLYFPILCISDQPKYSIWQVFSTNMSAYVHVWLIVAT